MRPGLGAHSFMKTMVAIKNLLRHTSFATLCLGVVFLYPDRLFSTFETIILLLLQNAAGAVPFGMKDLSETSFIFGYSPVGMSGTLMQFQ